MVGRLPNESPQYEKIRDELFEAEVALRDHLERVATLRRTLPLDTVIPDQDFEEIVDGVCTPVKLSQLFEDPSKPLLLMHFMYGKAQEHPCPMCTMWADGYDAVQQHLRQRVNFAVLVAGDAGAFEAYGRTRGWSQLRLISAAGSDLKSQLGFEDDKGAQLPGISVFSQQQGELIHFTSQCAFLGEAGFRGMDLLSPVWHFFDLAPDGRGDFMPSKSY